MVYDRAQNERDQEWRRAEFVISYPDWGDRGRMLGSTAMPAGTLHRPRCGHLTVERRLDHRQPAKIYTETKENFFNILRLGRSKSASGYGVVNYRDYKICRLCCADVFAEYIASCM